MVIVPNMANHKSAIKRMRQTAVRTRRKRAHRSRLRTQVKSFKEAVAGGSRSQVDALLGPTVSLVDKAVQKGVIHRNKGNRMKASISQAANRLPADS